MLNVSAQQTSFTTSLSSKKVGLEDYFTVTYRANKKGKFIPPKFVNFKVLGGPNESQSSSASFDGQNFVQSVSVSYSYTLQAKKTGGFNVPGAKLKVGNATIESRPAGIVVVPGMLDQRRIQQMAREKQLQELYDKNIFARMSISKSNVYIGEPIVVTYKVYISQLNVNLGAQEYPTNENFWIESIKLPEQAKRTFEVVDNVRYEVFTLKKEVLFPQKIGALKLKPFTLDTRINQSWFDAGTPKKLIGPGATINVKPLPNGAPASFDNQVGGYSLNATISNDTIKIGEPLDLKISIKGKGNLKQLNNINVDFPSDFEQYDPQIKENLNINGGGISGTKSFNYLLIPEHSGKYELGPIEFSYFDINTKSYKTVKSQKFSINVLKADGSVDQANMSSANVNKNQNIVGASDDIRYIVNETDLELKGTYFFSSIWHYIIVFGLGLSFFAFIIINNKIGAVTSDTKENRARKAGKIVHKQLAVAKQHLDTNNTSAFYKATLDGLYGYVSSKLILESSSLSKQTIVEELTAKSVSVSTSNQLIEILELCEMAQFASLGGNEQKVYKQSGEVINQIEKEFKA